MPCRSRVASLVLACGIALSTHAAAAGLTDLPQGQQRLASCMLSALNGVVGVTEPRLRVVALPGAGKATSPHTFLDYTYHHRDSRISPAVSPQEMEITGLLSKQTRALMLGGISPVGADLDDMDAGMLEITARWRSACGLELAIVTA